MRQLFDYFDFISPFTRHSVTGIMVQVFFFSVTPGQILSSIFILVTMFIRAALTRHSQTNTLQVHDENCLLLFVLRREKKKKQSDLCLMCLCKQRHFEKWQ